MVHLNIFQNILILVELFVDKRNFKIYQLGIIKKIRTYCQVKKFE